MNRIFSFGLAMVATTLLSSPAHAEWRGGGGGGGGRSGGGGGSVHASAPAVHANVGRSFSYHAPAARSFSYHGPAVTHFNAQVRPQFNSPSVNARFQPSTTFAPSVARSRTFAQPQRNAPSIAFGGTSTAGRAGGNTRAFTPPGNVSGGWNRGHVYSWNRHHYRFYNGGWIIADGGFYGSPYGDYSNGDDYGDQPYSTYSSPGYAYDSSSSDSLAVDVQNQLTSLGYAAGPPDGVLGPMTQNALASFQRDHNLPITGQIDGMTLRALGLN